MRAVEVFDLVFVKAAVLAQNDSSNEDGEESEAVRNGRERVEDTCRGECQHWIEALAGQLQAA